MRRAALVVVAALTASCGGDSGPSTTPPRPPRAAPLIALAWANVPRHLSLRVGDTHNLRLTLTKAVSARLEVESDHGRISVSSAVLNGGVLTATLGGLAAGRDTVRLTATARGYETAVTSFAVTVENRVVPPPPDPIPHDARFRRTFWRQMVFDAHACPDAGTCRSVTKPAVESRVVVVLSTTSPSFHIRTHDDAGNRTFSNSEIGRMRREIPRAVEALTGARFEGQILWNQDAVERLDWISIEEVTDLDDDVCGRARIGASSGLIRIASDYRAQGCPLGPLMAHEIGHAMGFFHVPSTSDVMHGTIGNRSTFSSRETYHAELAYGLGRGHPYADGRSGFSPAEQQSHPGEPAEPVIAVCRSRDH